jgi:hypothetical protein
MQPGFNLFTVLLVLNLLVCVLVRLLILRLVILHYANQSEAVAVNAVKQILCEVARQR